ncbi:MAG: hypothetical protein JWM89_1796 [Acidimicrobiales bacterium]|nr:hypothetical protein [Acidimicrobiales bacterium]
MTDDAYFAPSWLPKGIQVLDGQVLVGIVVDVPFADTVETVEDLIGTEIGAERLSATARSVRQDLGQRLFLDDPTTTSTTVARQGVWWAKDGATDADRLLVVFAIDPGPAADPYEPTWDSGLILLPFEPFTPGISRFDEADDVEATGDHAPVAGQVPVWTESDDDPDVLVLRPGDAPGAGGGTFTAAAVLWAAAFDLTDPASLGQVDTAGVIDALNGLLTDAGLAAVVDGDKVIAWSSSTPSGIYTVGGALTTLTFTPGPSAGNWVAVEAYVDGGANPSVGGTFLLSPGVPMPENLPPVPWPTHHLILAFQQPDISVGSWTLGVHDGASGTLLSSTADPDDNTTIWTWSQLPFARGLWAIDLMTLSDVDAGIIDITVNGEPVGQVDGYSDPAMPNVLTTRTFDLPRDVWANVVLANPTKNAVSTGYRMYVQAIVLRRTGD